MVEKISADLELNPVRGFLHIPATEKENREKLSCSLNRRDAGMEAGQPAVLSASEGNRLIVNGQTGIALKCRIGVECQRQFALIRVPETEIVFTDEIGASCKTSCRCPANGGSLLRDIAGCPDT